ncbi:TPA: hypothetical protein N0F65_006735 [Lagenidium giganteum]|uniref:Uncharacterized protein n=1 Tax=Lagenidium giganteum TaxID=4803 RepID=A0AAV2YY45_9STRA|nr:TPA: hypothetical protein N0F65_006735 [Lagenidium giganteum]
MTPRTVIAVADDSAHSGANAGESRSRNAPCEVEPRHRFVESANLRRRSCASRVFDHHLEFSWSRSLISICTYALMFSDVLRSGLGIPDLSNFGVYGANEFAMYGPWYYQVFAANKTDPPRPTAPVWSYKFSGTSIVWKAFAIHFDLPEYPRCFLSTTPPFPTGWETTNCKPADFFNTAIAFDMIDAMVRSAAKLAASPSRLAREDDSSSPTQLVLRTTNHFYDRLHHYIFPQFFVFPVWRTNQLVHYPYQSLFVDGTNSSSRGGLQRTLRILSPCRKTHRQSVRPFFCDDVYINYRRACLATDRACRDIGVIWVHTMRRLMERQLQFPHAIVDLTFLTGQEDFQASHGGVGYMARRKLDITTVIRARNCTSSTHDNCTTIFLEDYRYEGAVFSTSIVEWYDIVAALRMFAQVYFYVRVALLFWSCYATRRAEMRYADAKLLEVLRAAIRVFVRIPTPSLLYGSPIPVVCYALAHLIDAPLTYEVIAQHFSVPLGKYKFDAKVFFVFTAVQMRNIWCLVLFLHILLYLSTRRSDWLPVDGIAGIPKFSLGLVASITVLTQLRQLSFRDTNILTSARMVDGSHGGQRLGRYTSDHSSNGNMLLEGVLLDVKFFSCIIAVIVVFVSFIRSYRTRRATTDTMVDVLVARTPAPFSAGALWPTAAMSHSEAIEGTITAKQAGIGINLTICLVDEVKVVCDSPDWKGTTHRNLEDVDGRCITLAEWPENRHARTAFLHYQMKHIHERRLDVNALVMLVNLICMSDPWTFLQLRFGVGQIVHYFHCKSTGCVFMLPDSAMVSFSKLGIPCEDIVCLGSVNCKQLRWADLIQIG